MADARRTATTTRKRAGRYWRVGLIGDRWFPIWAPSQKGELTNPEAHVICDMRNAELEGPDG